MSYSEPSDSLRFKLYLARPLHQAVAVVPDGEDVRGQLPDLLLPVELDLLAGVDGQDLVRVHSHQDRASEGLQEGVIVINCSQ